MQKAAVALGPELVVVEATGADDEGAFRQLAAARVEACSSRRRPSSCAAASRSGLHRPVPTYRLLAESTPAGDASPRTAPQAASTACSTMRAFHASVSV